MKLNAFDVICRNQWAIEPNYLEAMLEIAERRNWNPEALSRELGEQVRQTQNATIRNGVATLPVRGPLFRYANLFTEFSGATSVEQLSKDLNTLVNDPQVRAIIIDMDSPGGEVNGTRQMAQMFHQAAERKPAVCWVGGMAASGGYWLASAMPKIVIDPTAVLGSVGCVAVVQMPTKEAEERKGVKTYQFVSSQSPQKRPDLDSPAGQQEVQQRVDAIASVFIEEIAGFRKTTPEHVMEHFGRGGVKIGADAVASGMADKLGTYEQVLEELAEKATPRAIYSVAKETPKMSKLTDSIRAAFQGAGWTPPKEDEEAAPAAASVDEEKEAMKAELDRLRASEESRVSELIGQARANAFDFIDDQIKAERVLPSEVCALRALASVLAEDDARSAKSIVYAMPNSEVSFEASSRVDAFKQTILDRPKHHLTAESVKVDPNKARELQLLQNQATTPGVDGHEQPMTEERRRELLGKSQYGRELLSALDNKN